MVKNGCEKMAVWTTGLVSLRHEKVTDAVWRYFARACATLIIILFGNNDVSITGKNGFD